MPALNELHEITRVVESHMSVLAVVGGATVNNASRASQQTYYLTRRAFTALPYTARFIKSYSAPEIGTLSGRAIHEVFDGLEHFGGEPTFWESYFDPSRIRCDINEVLRDAAAEWSLFFRTTALSIATHAEPDIDIATWAIRLLEDIGDARVQIKNSSIRPSGTRARSG
ncbi:hypothetical protein [Frondihabitans sucicola]|nr:hypothetical protein [Frondihabitans sucicola]